MCRFAFWINREFISPTRFRRAVRNLSHSSLGHRRAARLTVFRPAEVLLRSTVREVIPGRHLAMVRFTENSPAGAGPVILVERHPAGPVVIKDSLLIFPAAGRELMSLPEMSSPSQSGMADSVALPVLDLMVSIQPTIWPAVRPLSAAPTAFTLRAD